MVIYIVLFIYGSTILPGCWCRDCVWRIKVDSGRQVRLNITSFSLETHADCRYDYLEIR